MDLYNDEALLYENKFITPEDVEDLTEEEKELFIRSFKSKLSLNRNDNNTANNNESVLNQILPKKISTYRSSVLVIDSKYRNKKIYPQGNDFIYDFPRKFTNIASINLIKTIIPNTDSVIKDTPVSLRNNRIYWINSEDFDINYPVYSVALKPGSYTALTILDEITSKLNYVKRRGGTGLFHSFSVSINLDTDVCNFTSLNKTQLGINPLSVTSGSGIITVTQPDHGYINSQVVYFSGINTFSGISAFTMNSNFPITVIDANTYYFTVNEPAISTIIGGGNTVTAGAESKFKFLWGRNTGTIQFNLGFPQEDSSFTLPSENPVTTYTFSIDSGISGYTTEFAAVGHRLSIGDVITIANLDTIPDIRNNILTVISVTANTFVVDYTTSFVDNTTISGATVQTGLINLYYPNHGLNSAYSINNYSADVLAISTLLPHNFNIGDKTWITYTNTSPAIDGLYTIISILDSLTFLINYTGGIMASGSYAYIGYSKNIYLYNVLGYKDGLIGGIFPNDYINNQELQINKIVNSSNFSIRVPGAYATSTQSGGGYEVRISSSIHGFNGTQTNELSSVTINRPISLQGVDYIYLCSPQIGGTVENNANIQDAFSIILLNQPPGAVCFNSFVDNPKIFYDSPLVSLESMRITVKNPDGSLFDFNSIDYSFALRIMEVVDIFENSNISSQRNASYDYSTFFSIVDKT